MAKKKTKTQTTAAAKTKTQTTAAATSAPSSPTTPAPSIGRIVHYHHEVYGVVPAIVIATAPGAVTQTKTGPTTGPATVDLELFGIQAKHDHKFLRGIAEGTSAGTYAWPSRV